MSFHVIAPSLPNYGFSSGVSQRGFGLAQYAETCHKLMLQLGYDRYVTQAGDWGYWITRSIGRLYPESCLASHFNMVLANSPDGTETPTKFDPARYTDEERAGLERTTWFQKEGMGQFLKTPNIVPGVLETKVGEQDTISNNRPDRKPSPTPSKTPPLHFWPGSTISCTIGRMPTRGIRTKP